MNLYLQIASFPAAVTFILASGLIVPYVALAGNFSAADTQSDIVATNYEQSNATIMADFQNSAGSSTLVRTASVGSVSSEAGSTNVAEDAAADLFVFNQSINVEPDAVLSGEAGGGAVSIGAGDLNAVSGVVTVNQAAGVGDQQANNIRIDSQRTGNGVASAASTSINIESQQTLNDLGHIDGNSVIGPGDSAMIGSDALQNVSGVVAVNQASGIANQQINNVICSNPSALRSSAPAVISR